VPSTTRQGEETAITSIPHPSAPQLTIGVDTHLDVHVAHAADQLGRCMDTVQVPTTPAGYQHLLAWARGLGQPVAWGVEGTGSYGAALARFLAANSQVVLEVNRPDRQARRRHGKSDPLDAQAAAKAVQAGDATVTPKAGTGQVEMIRCLRVARHTAMRARTQTINALKALLVTAPAELREQLRGLPATRLVRAAADLQPGPVTSPLAAAMLALRTLARRHQALSGEIGSLTTELDRLTAKAAPQLVALFGVGQDSAGALLVAAGDNPGRLRSDARVLDAVRRLTDPGLLRQDHPPSPQPGRRPPSQRRAAPDRAGAAVPPPADQGLHGQTPHRRQVQKGDHPLFEAIRRTGGVRRAEPDEPRQPHLSHLTAIRASLIDLPCSPQRGRRGDATATLKVPAASGNRAAGPRRGKAGPVTTEAWSVGG
jgi:transposase